MVPMNWKEKFLDELFSQKTLFTLVFALLIVFVKLSDQQSDTFNNLIWASLGASAVKSIGGGLKAFGLVRREKRSLEKAERDG